MFIDTHTHFYDEWLLPDAEEAVRRALEAGVGKMIQADVDSRERPAMWKIGNRHPGVIYQMLGLYPGSVAQNWREELDQVHRIATMGCFDSSEYNPADQVQDEFGRGHNICAGPSPMNTPKNDIESISAGPGPGERIGPGPKNSQTSIVSSLDQIHSPHNTHGFGGDNSACNRPEDCVRRSPIVAIGEIGLDYHEGLEFVREQKEVLRLQLELAAKMDLPVNIHLRDAWEDLFGVLADCRHLHLRGNLHCFTASYEIFERANRYGDFSVGIGGVVTFKNASLAKTLERIPMDKILLETDAPYLAPVPHRGQRNESAYLPLIAAKVADIKGLSIAEIETITTNNAQKLFNLQ